jgi:hypothetical protein
LVPGFYFFLAHRMDAYLEQEGRTRSMNKKKRTDGQEPSTGRERIGCVEGGAEEERKRWEDGGRKRLGFWD